MPDIYPTGKLQLYSGIRLDPTYTHTLSYESPTAKENFWGNTGTGTLMKHNLTARQYQRVNSGVCEVALSIDKVYDINYMRFQNTDFSNRWFYAFVTRVEYVNNSNSRLYYELDVLTTFYHDWTFYQCFVERMHAATDTAGDNLVEEPIKFGEPQAFNRIATFFNQFKVCIAAADYATINNVRQAYISQYGNTVSGVFTPVSVNGCYLNTFDLTNDTDVTNFQKALSSMSEDELAMINIFLFPKALFSDGDIDVKGRQAISFVPYNVWATRPTTINGYTPKNKKLFTYPYCYLCVDNGNVTNNYRYEFFNHVSGYSDYMFVIKGVPLPTPNVFIAPVNYKNVLITGAGEKYVYEERLDFPKLPQVAFPIDSYAAWLAQTESSRQNKVFTGAAAGVGTGLAAGAKLGGAIGTAGGPIGTGVGAAIGAVLGGVLGAVGAKVANDMAITEAADMKNKASGSASESSGLADSHWGILMKQMTITADDAKTIDSFFDMFGYAQNRIMQPNIRSRDHWNYIKTNGCNMWVTGGIPADYTVKIKAIHDAGVTYWKNHNEVGNYALSNTIST
ncbi:MAG: hypothetical protein IKE92_14715 [Clostridiales bacterium]|nr:hypothetical protein [Clostridiales bacterium]